MKSFIIGASMVVSILSCFAQQSIDLNNWKFKAGDSLEWANPGYDDSEWKSIKVGGTWASQGYADGGYAWYRTKFMLPLSMKEKIKTGVLRVTLGRINDFDQTSLNGAPLGYNARLVPLGDTNSFHAVHIEPEVGGLVRNYALSVDDPRLFWGKENMLAVRILDQGSMGGLCTLPVAVSMGDIRDCLCIDADAKVLEVKPGGKLSKTIILKNTSSLPKVTGKLAIAITNQDSGQLVASETYAVNLAQENAAFTIDFPGDLRQRMQATYTVSDSRSDARVTYIQTLPYILTPTPSEKPAIHGAKVVGVGTGRDFLFRIPATGTRPMTFSADSLPDGLSLDPSTGIITGSVKRAGEYLVTLKAKNKKGKTARDLKIVVGGLLALTPPMGWNSWNGEGYDVSQAKILTTADILSASGLADHGYNYVNTDIGWEPMQRNADGTITPNAKFPNMKAQADYIHSKGFKAGIYISSGPVACSVWGVPLGIGSYPHYEADAQMFADWGFDYLKFDWCSYPTTDFGPAGLQRPFALMRAALNKTQRDVVFSLGGWNSWTWGGAIGGNLWRVVGDSSDRWVSVLTGFNLEAAAPYAKPGNWNDPDMLVVGHGWFGNNTVRLHATRLTPDEQYTHLSLWALLSAPLLISCDLTKLDDFTLNLLENDEVISIDQDPLGKQALPAVKNPNCVIMEKDLEDGSIAVGLFNLAESEQKITAAWTTLKISGKQKVRDVWRQKDLGTFTDSFESSVPPHGVVLVRVIPADK